MALISVRDSSTLLVADTYPQLWYVTDKKCPFTGDVSIRGRILTGRVVSTKMTRTLVIRRDYLHYIPKYSEYGLALYRLVH